MRSSDSQRKRRASGRTACRGRSRAGFTLIEITVVIVVMAILAGMLVPNLEGAISSVRLDSAAHRIGELFDYCYHAALTTGRVHGVVVSSDRRRLMVVSETPAEELDPTAVEPAAVELVQVPGFVETLLPEGITVSEVTVYQSDLVTTDSDEFRILFFPDGTTEFATLYVENASGDRREIDLNGISGTVSVAKPSPADSESQSNADEESAAGDQGASAL